jgi:protein CSF1
LGGRIFFKQVRYHGENVSVLVRSGFITWHYWYPRVRNAKVIDATTEKKASTVRSSTSDNNPDEAMNREEKAQPSIDTSKFPFRITIHVEGVEAFIYDRTPAYRNIVDHFTRVTASDASVNNSNFKINMSSENVKEKDGIVPRNSQNDDESQATHRKPELPFWLSILPISVTCKTGALILGNHNTKTLITVSFSSATGSFNAGESGPLDSFQYIFGADIKDVIIDFPDNPHYRESQLAAAVRAKRESTNEHKSHQRRKRGLLKSLFKLPAWFKSTSSVKASSFVEDPDDFISENLQFHVPGEEPWRGLSRYHDSTLMNEHEEWSGIEYAASTRLANCPKIGFTFYWDAPGKVPGINVDADMEDDSVSDVDHINGSAAPEYGMEILVGGGTVQYGPWTDQQRIIFQNIFFPPIFADAIPGKRLKPGDWRISSEFKLRLSIEEDTTLRIPVREPSKDWEWKGRADAAAGPRDLAADGKRNGLRHRRRPFGASSGPVTVSSNARQSAWLDVKVARNTTVNYVSDMIARRDGFRGLVNADICSLEISTSVNHGLLWRSGPTTLNCDLSVPIKWNALRDWNFSVVNDNLELFILRDHLFLIMDLVADWTAGPLPDFYTFTPFKYHLNVQFRNFKLYLNSNDSNIINDPSDMNDNNFLILHGEDLRANIHIPLDHFRPVLKEVTFDLIGRNFNLELCLNSRNTVKAFVTQKDIVTVDTVTLDGSYLGHSESWTQLTDRLLFNIHGSRLTIWAFGFIIHHLINLKENYFGDYLHFKTWEEYQALLRSGEVDSEQRVMAQKSNRSTDLDVILCISVDDTRVMLPTKVYKADECIALTLPSAGVDLRINNYYMDLQVDLSPMSLSLSHSRLDNDSPRVLDGKTELSVQSANVSMHRAFGLPPTEPSYASICSIDVGDVFGECSEEFVEKLFRSVHALVLTATDEENTFSLIPITSSPDATFLNVSTKAINVWVHVGTEAILFNIAPATVQFNDWATSNFSQRLKAFVPEIVISIAQQEFATRQRMKSGKLSKVPTYAYIKTSLSIDMLRRSINFIEEREKQQTYIALQDSRTHRTPFLVDDEYARAAPNTADDDPPAMSYPLIGKPITNFNLKNAKSNSNSKHVQNVSLRESLAEAANRRTTRTVGHRNLPNKSTAKIKPPETRQKLQSAQSSDDFETLTALSDFPLLNIPLDVNDLPTLSHHEPRERLIRISNPVEPQFREDTIHSTFLISTGPGIQGFIKSEAQQAIINLVSMLMPSDPDDILDFFQGRVFHKLVDEEKSRQRQPESIEVRLDVRALKLRFINTFAVRLLQGEAIDEFEIYLSGLTLIGRHGLANRLSSETHLSVHTTFDRFEITATEKCSAHDNVDVALNISIVNFLFWLRLAEKYTSNVSLESIQVEVASSKIQYLSAMMDRTTRLIERIAQEGQRIDNNYRNRLHRLVYALTMETQRGGLSDPHFFSEHPYLLRASENHIRNHDSWKMVSRLRYQFDNMTTISKDALSHTLRTAGVSTANARETVMQIWSKWRVWDLKNIKGSRAMRYLYPRSTTPVQKILSSSKHLQFGLRCREISLVIDRASNESSFETSLIALDFDSSSPQEPSGPSAVDGPVRETKLILTSQKINFELNWELLVLAESILNLLQDHGEKEAQLARSTSKDSSRGSRPRNIVQAVFKVASTAVNINTINLRSTIANTDFVASITASFGSTAADGQLISVLLHSTNAFSEFRSNSTVLLFLKADSPNLFLSQNVPPGKSRSKEVEWTVAGTCSHLSINVKEEILDLVEITDHIIRDEVAELQRRFGSGFDPESDSKTTVVQSSRPLPKLNLALVMDDYSISIALLQSISYQMKGKVGRISVVPKLVRPRALDVNFIMDAHEHSFVNNNRGVEHTISIFELPPVNGNLNIRRANERTVFNVSTIIEQTIVNANEIYKLASAFRQPEITKTIRSLQSDISSVQNRINILFPASTVSASVENLRRSTLVYNLRATLVGLKVTTTTKLKALRGGMASLDVGLDSVQLRAYNVMHDDGDILPLPELSAKINRIFVELGITDKKGSRSCGQLSLLANIRITRRSSKTDISGVKRNYQMELKSIRLQAFADTASAVVNILNELQDDIKELDLSRERRYLQRLRQPTRKPSANMLESFSLDSAAGSSGFFTSAFSISLTDIQIAWIVGNSVPAIQGHEPQDLVLSIKVIDLRSKSRSTSRLTIEEVQLQMVPVTHDRTVRSFNSALLPEMIFNVAYASNEEDGKISIQARGKGLDVRLESHFILPASMITRSISLAVDKFQEASGAWNLALTESGSKRRNPFSNKRLSSLLIDADFAGAVVRLSGRSNYPRSSTKRGEDIHHGRFGQFVSDSSIVAATFRSPGLAFKVEYSDSGKDSTFTSEVKISGSSNSLAPSVVPLILDISNSVKLIVEDTDNELAKQNAKMSQSQSFFSDERLLNADPEALLGSTSFNLGIRICKQEFSLSCAPIARVDATVGVDDIYITANNITSPDEDMSFAVGASFENLQASVQHVYSRESTFSFNMERLVLSVMNSKHLSGTAGIAAVLKVNPMKTHINARKLHDFLIFRDIWIPEEIRQASVPTTHDPDSQEYLVHRYQQVANATAFPWTATLAIERIAVDLDMGQTIGRASLSIDNLWASSKKDSNWEQNLCVGVEKVAIQSKGRTSGFIELADVQVRTLIHWPIEDGSLNQTPLIQASASFAGLRAKMAFEYEVFGIIDIAPFKFIMYNVRETGPSPQDRLVASLDGDRVQVSCTVKSASLVMGLLKAVEKLIQDNKTAYSESIKSIEGFMKRNSISNPRMESSTSIVPITKKENKEQDDDAPISLHTDVVVSLRGINFGVFRSFSDSTLFLVNASNIQARFAVKMDHTGRIHSGLGMTLGQLQVALTQTPRPSEPKTIDQINVEEVIQTIRSARGGIILGVPKVRARMQTWQAPLTYHIDYIFRSSFEGKVDVGWNFARIEIIRDMWNMNNEALTSRLGKALPGSAVRITDEKTGRITAVVELPQSKYTYRPLQPPIIDTPQLRDLGEATPPVEWIGLHRERLPNVTHHIVIMPLLGVAREVEKAYERILGSSQDNLRE